MTAEAILSPARDVRAAPTAVATWLFVCCALVFAMVVVGGVTRLTSSGLSIVEWQPIVGTIPPLTDADWQQTFEKYQQTPQYRLVNQGMTLAGFKGIFWWEYIHRLLGRVIGIAFFLPLAWFTVRRQIPQGYGWKLLGLRTRWAARRDGLVHGEERPGRQSARFPIPPHRASCAGARDFRCDVLGGSDARRSPTCPIVVGS